MITFILLDMNEILLGWIILAFGCKQVLLIPSFGYVDHFYLKAKNKFLL